MYNMNIPNNFLLQNPGPYLPPLIIVYGLSLQLLLSIVVNNIQTRMHI